MSRKYVKFDISQKARKNYRSANEPTVQSLHDSIELNKSETTRFV